MPHKKAITIEQTLELALSTIAAEITRLHDKVETQQELTHSDREALTDYTKTLLAATDKAAKRAKSDNVQELSDDELMAEAKKALQRIRGDE